MNAGDFFEGKRVTLVGLGLLGRGVGDAEYLARHGAELIVTDLKSREALAESLARLAQFPNISYTLGEHKLEDFRGRDLIIKAAGVPLDSPYIAEAKKSGIPVRMSADLFMELSGVETIGITGTRGKSTTTHMIFAILQKAYELGLSRGATSRTGKPVLGGNVRGVSTLALLDEVRGGEIAVLELDSWQCQGLGEAQLSPHIAVFTTFMNDHVNYYQSDPAQYLLDKANIFLYQGPDDTLVAGRQCAPTLIEAFGEHIVSRAVIADDATLPADWELMLPGAHNRYDAGCALAAARAVGVGDEVSRAALESFKGVPGRLERVGEAAGVKYYNDTTATTPEATIAALEALREKYGDTMSIFLILGGADKGLDMSALLAALPKYATRVFLLAGSGTDRIRGELERLPAGMIYHTSFDTLDAAVREASRTASRDDIILLSPAFASFGMFKNEYDRGDQFNALVAKV